MKIDYQENKITTSKAGNTTAVEEDENQLCDTQEKWVMLKEKIR